MIHVYQNDDKGSRGRKRGSDDQSDGHHEEQQPVQSIVNAQSKIYILLGRLLCPPVP